MFFHSSCAHRSPTAQHFIICELHGLAHRSMKADFRGVVLSCDLAGFSPYMGLTITGILALGPRILRPHT